MQPQPITETATTNSLALTEAEVQRLLRDNSVDTRADMTGRIATAYNQVNLSPQETLIAEQIFRLLLRDTEERVRVTLAENIKQSIKIPHDVVIALARDVEQVSLPVLQYSEVLTDKDLLEIIESTEQMSRYLAISRRRVVSDVVTDSLLKKDSEEVAQALVNNEGASLSDFGYSKLIEQFKENDGIMQTLSKRPHLPVNVVDKMIQVVSASIAETIKKKYRISDEEIDKEIDHEVEKVREKETLRLIKTTESDAATEDLITQLHAAGRLNPSVILSALCQGNFDFFEMSLARLSNVPSVNARKLINDRGDLGFRAIYNKSGLPDAMFPAVKLLLRIVRELDVEGEKRGSSRYANRIVERILQYSEDNEMENLSYIIALVRRTASNG